MTFPANESRCRPLADWPEMDRTAWESATTPVGLMRYRRRHGTKLGGETRKKITKGYGRWLSFLDQRYPGVLAQAPGERATAPRLRAYFRALQAAGNSPGTIDGRFYELRTALRLIAPDFDGSVIYHLDGSTMRRRLDLTPRSVIVPAIEELMDWGLEMIQRSSFRSYRTLQLTAFRDGLLITVLAAGGRRRRSLTAIRIGRELSRSGDRYVVDLNPDQVKTGRPDRFEMPPELTPYIERYLDEVRPALVGSHSDPQALWVGSNGRPMSSHYLTNHMLTLTKARFGLAFGPHRFRHSICTGLAYHAPKATGLAASFLGISPEVVAGHYDRANGVLAQRAFTEILAQRKRGGR